MGIKEPSEDSVSQNSKAYQPIAHIYPHCWRVATPSQSHPVVILHTCFKNILTCVLCPPWDLGFCCYEAAGTNMIFPKVISTAVTAVSDRMPCIAICNLPDILLTRHTHTISLCTLQSIVNIPTL